MSMARLSTDPPRALEHSPLSPCCQATYDGWSCTAIASHIGHHAAYLPDGSVGERWDDPPEYGLDDAEAQRIAETFADANREHDRIEAEEAGRG